MDNRYRPLRSLLYVPGSNERAMKKAPGLAADGIIFDLEDAVGDRDKVAARQRVCVCLAKGDIGKGLIAVRINDPRSLIGQEDLRAILATDGDGPDAIIIPKVASAGDIVGVSSMIDQHDAVKRHPDVQIWAMMETPLAILNVREIAELAMKDVPRLGALVMGINDLERETGTKLMHIAPWVMQCVLVAKAYGLAILDGVYNRFADLDGFRADCELGRSRGMDGKTLIHPQQIELCNSIFSPTKDELQEARELVALFEKPEHRHVSVLPFHGRMVERLHYESAVKTLQLVTAIAEGEAL